MVTMMNIAPEGLHRHHRLVLLQIFPMVSFPNKPVTMAMLLEEGRFYLPLYSIAMGRRMKMSIIAMERQENPIIAPLASNTRSRAFGAGKISSQKEAAAAAAMGALASPRNEGEGCGTTHRQRRPLCEQDIATSSDIISMHLLRLRRSYFPHHDRHFLCHFHRPFHRSSCCHCRRWTGSIIMVAVDQYCQHH